MGSEQVIIGLARPFQPPYVSVFKGNTPFKEVIALFLVRNPQKAER